MSDNPEDEFEYSEENCVYGFGACIDSFCRDIEHCLGCPLLKSDLGAKSHE
jgi:hypothetical protein